jgi:cell division protein FtsI/penicillin-binding protein 2
VSLGDLTVERIITKSSNIGAAKIGIKLGEQRLYDYMRDFGFGTRTAIPVPGEVPGILHPVKKWSKVSIAQIPMGQGVAVTRLQMMMAMCAIANNGWLMRPMLVDRLEDNDHNVVARYTPQRVKQVISESAAKEMVKALKTVVSSEGTAPSAALEHYTVAGKTGTAQKAEHGVYVPGKYFSSFIGFFPADNPELCISVTMDEPKGGHYGGETAAPVFHEIAERAANYLNIRPEDGEAPPPVGNGLPGDNLPARLATTRTPQ